MVNASERPCPFYDISAALEVRVVLYEIAPEDAYIDKEIEIMRLSCSSPTIPAPRQRSCLEEIQGTTLSQSCHP